MKLKHFLIGIGALLALFFSACDSSGGSDSALQDGELWADSKDVSSNMDLDPTGAVGGISYSAGNSRASSTTNKIYFRSSDIEFWSIDTENYEADINSIFSVKYQDGSESTDVTSTLDYSDGRSLEYELGDLDSGSVIFTPYNDYSVTLGSVDEEGNALNGSWNSDVNAFITDGLSEINLARLDIGDGRVTFIIDGEKRQVLNSNKEAAVIDDYNMEELEARKDSLTTEEYDMYYEIITTLSGFDANSIFFVDKALLSEPVLVEIKDQDEVVAGTMTASDLSISSDDYTVVQTILKNSNEVDTTTMIDVDGALFLPLTPADLTGFDPDTQYLQINLEWNIASAIHKANDIYFMDNRVRNTAFNFSVSISFE